MTGEPSIALDGDGTIYVTGPTGIGRDPALSASPLWKSTDGGQRFIGPVSTGTAGQTAAEVGGGDSDLVFDDDGHLFVATLWLGNSQIAVSTDRGVTFTANPISHPTPVDDRQWLAYDPVNDSLYMVWDGGDGLHVGRAVIREQTGGTAAHEAGSLVFVQDVVAVPETPVGGTAIPDGNGAIRQCVCPPGSIAVDPAGNVYIAYSSQDGMAISESRDGGLTWTQALVPDTATGSAADLDYVFHTDGNLYVVWSQGPAAGPIRVYFSYRPAGATTWHAPVLVSTTKDAVFGTVATFPGRKNAVDVAYYGTDDHDGSPSGASSSTKWNLYLAQSLNPLGGGAFTTTVAFADVHRGPIEFAGIGGGSDRSLGDFFGLAVDEHGLADIVTAVGNAASGTKIHFVHQVSAASMRPPAAPSAKKTARAPGTTSVAYAPSSQTQQRAPAVAGTNANAAQPRAVEALPAEPVFRPFEGAAAGETVPAAQPGPPILLPLLLLSAFFVIGGGLAYRLGRR
jgi:hypothetical protein